MTWKVVVAIVLFLTALPGPGHASEVNEPEPRLSGPWIATGDLHGTTIYFPIDLTRDGRT